MGNALQTLHARLIELCGGGHPECVYRVPGLWISPGGGERKAAAVDPYEFYRDRIAEILAAPDAAPLRLNSAGEWSAQAVVYNMFVRHTTAFDHDGNGALDLPLDAAGFRETGTFLKAIALLPYVKHLGCNTIHCLPVTAIGHDGNKGTLGSPYAIRNPYKLDENLSEPFLGLDAETQFAAFVEAAHRLGIRVVLEFVFRTASKDSDWILDHPNWFYWIRADIPDRTAGEAAPDAYGSPSFDEEEMKMIHTRVRKNDFSSLPPPGMRYREMFAPPPEKVEYVDGRYVGFTEKEERLRIPGAFADWPPMDVQPPWNDVTYLKLYDDDRFNYIAYNTVRMYDARLARKENENRGLWNTILNIIPHYQKKFDIDGVMIDMGHALPMSLKQTLVDRARRNNPDFAFWEENFVLSPRSRAEGYNATVGYLPFDQHNPVKHRTFVSERATQGTPIPFFAAAENHNTPRAAVRPGGIRYSRMAWIVGNFLPGIPFIHQGFELGERFPVNTGLDFTPEEIARIPSHTLPLFSEGALSWESDEEFTPLIHRVAEIRAEVAQIVIDPTPRSFHMLPTSNENILAFVRSTDDEQLRIAVVANMNCLEPVDARLVLPASTEAFHDLLTGREFRLEEQMTDYRFEPGEALVGYL